MNFCLSDLVPPLRWSDASAITLLHGQPDLPEAWWRSLPMPHVLAAIGPESLGELLTEIALEHWPAAAVGDVLPALHVLDPDDADEPQVAIALDRAGSWTGLLALTSRELMDQPFIQARPVLNTLFSAVLVRLAPSPRPARATDPPAIDPAAKSAAVPVSEPASEPVAVPVAEPASEPVAEPVIEPVVESAAGPEPEPAEAVEAEPVAVVVAIAEPEPPAEEPVEPDEVVEHRAAGVTDEPEADAQAEEPEAEAPEAAEPEEPEAGAEQAEAGEPEAEEPGADAQEEEPGADEPEAAEPEAAEPEAAEPEAAEPEAAEAEAEEAGAEAPEAGADEPEAAADERGAEADEGEGSEDEESVAAPAKAVEGSGPRLPALIESAFADLDDKSWAVAQNRVFTDQPSAVEQLAKLFAVSPAEINATEIALRSRLERWLASDEAAPYRAHLDELRGTIGEAAPREQLIGAADWHAREIRALEVPAWQFVKATLAGATAAAAPGQAGQGPAAGPAAVQEPPPVPVSPFEEPPVEEPPVGAPPVGVSPVEVSASEEQVRFGAFTPHDPAEQNGEQAAKPYQPLKDVSQTRRCFRQPDGRWYLRVDVTAEHLGGAECQLPTGFAAYLGLSPGESRTVRSAAGELTMSWHGRPVLESVSRLLMDVGAKEGGHVFLTLSDEGVLRARHLPVAAPSADKITRALRLVCYTAPDAGLEVAARVIATRIGMTGPVALPDVLARLRERGDRDLLDLLD
ncbi:hypothetical protein ACIBEJ_32065 [Nonomuraea sp. NPDC050790]|uniref:hypothetical protein n=1 Tax=Nonomuraea sp. NPDC050790 TaxID=3364371 RepID=UPI0037A36B39